MQAFTAVYLPGWLIFIGGMLIISSVNAPTVQAMVNRAGRSNTQLWYMKPGIFVHELLHAVVARLFGLQVTNFSMRADVVSGSAAHVSLRYTRLGHNRDYFCPAVHLSGASVPCCWSWGDGPFFRQMAGFGQS